MSIADTINDNLPRGAEKYRDHIDRGIALLVDREQEIVEALLDFAAGKGADEAEVRTLMSDLGMEVPDVEADHDADHDELGTLRGHVDSLLEFARSKGYRG